MASVKLLQIQENIKREFSIVLQQEGRYIYGDAFVTVTKAELSPDLSTAKFYVSVYNTDNKQAVIMMLEEAYYRLKRSLNYRMKKRMRRIPEFQVFLDDTLDEMQKLNTLFDKLHEQRQMGEEE